MKNKWIKKGDKVLVIAGNDRGRTGEVVARKEDKILIQGVNIRKRHMKSREQGKKSEIINIERPIHISNVALCDASGKKLKLKIKQTANKEKRLVTITNGKEDTYRVLRKPRKQ